MSIRYAHTNLIATDWRKLAQFYESVFDCVEVPPIRSQEGDWLADGTGVKNAKLEGIHLLLPGYGDEGPTLEIYSYGDMLTNQEPAPNRKGLGHLAFEVRDVEGVARNVVHNGGQLLGKVVRRKIDGVGLLTFVYATDPEGNIIEIQHWERN